ncbi:MAG: cupin domain-containing protein [Candidatus Heteroscillospira sp.]|jgi:quercetin dioxygenase-like cupin family protein
MVRKPQVLTKSQLRGGKGDVDFHYIISEEEMMGHGPMYAKLVLKPGSSIGWHQHVGNTEPYYVLSGQGRYTDSDGTVYTIVPGDVCYNKCGHSHSVENLSETEDLEIMALILNEA